MRKLHAATRVWLAATLILLSVGCSLAERLIERPSPTPPPTETSPTSAPPESTATLPPKTDIPAAPKAVFAIFREPVVDVQPSLAMEEVQPGLANVTIPFALSQAQLDRLAADGFVVSPGAEKEFFTLYEKARYQNEPIFVTSDSLLHVYHLLFDKVLRTAETTSFIPALRQLNQALLVQADATYQQLRGGAWEDAARRTVAFVAVAGRLVDPGFPVPDYASNLVQGELTNIESASGMMPSPIFPGLENGEDYTQYIPRGHYTRSEDLKAYFKSMMWYGRMTFRLETNDPQVGRAETRSALLLVHALRTATVNGHPAMDSWQDLYSPTVFFVGRSDDLTVLQYGELMDTVYGEGVQAAALVDEARLDDFIAMAKQLPPPKILGIVIMDTDDEEAVTKGLRFMGQRFVPDAYIFRQLIYRNVGTRENRRGLPKGLDVFAAMGSQRAYFLLDQMGETSYENYPQQMTEVQSWLSGLTVEDWTETLYNTWLYTFYPLLDVPGDGYPTFMQSDAWLDKQLNTTLGSWAELKHDTILYAKQVYAELGGGPPPPPPLPPLGYVEPVPLFYARLSALTSMTHTGLADRGMLSEQDANSLTQLEDLANALQTMAEKELQGEGLTDKEQSRIRYYGGELEQLTMAAADSEDGPPGTGGFLEEEPQAAVVADVATDPGAAGGPAVLEVGVGRINVIHVIVPVVGPTGATVLQVAKGGVFSYYEFPHPASNRLTDESWRQMLDDGTAPSQPAWTQSFFTPEGEFAEAQAAVLSFQKSVTSAYWEQRESFREEEAALAQFAADIQQLTQAKQYMGHQLVSTHFRSFDRQSDTRVVVAVRELWQDSLYPFSGDYPSYNEEAIANRGPYALDVTYTIDSQVLPYGTVWVVTRAVYDNEPPGW